MNPSVYNSMNRLKFAMCCLWTIFRISLPTYLLGTMVKQCNSSISLSVVVSIKQQSGKLVISQRAAASHKYIMNLVSHGKKCKCAQQNTLYVCLLPVFPTYVLNLLIFPWGHTLKSSDLINFSRIMYRCRVLLI